MLEPEEEQAGLHSDAVTLIVLGDREPVAHSGALRALAAVHTYAPQPHPHHTQATVTIGASMRLEKALKWDVQVPGLGAGG